MKMYNVRDAWRIIPRSWTILFYILSLFFFSFSFSLAVMESSKEGIDGFLNIHRVLVVEFSTDRHDLSAREKIDFSHLAELLRRGWCVVESARTIFAATSILLAPHRRPQLYRVEGEVCYVSWKRNPWQNFGFLGAAERMSPFAPSPASCFADLRTSVKEGESRGEREARTLHYALRTRFPNNFLLKMTRRKERFLSENFSSSFFPLNFSSSFFSPPRPVFILDWKSEDTWIKTRIRYFGGISWNRWQSFFLFSSLNIVF